MSPVNQLVGMYNLAKSALRRNIGLSSWIRSMGQTSPNPYSPGFVC
jgi:hypothetical protein